MALSHAHVIILNEIRRQALIPTMKSICELGQQNWYGDVNPSEIYALIDRYTSEDKKATIRKQLDEAISRREVRDPRGLFDIAKVFYQVIFEYNEYTAIDLNGVSGEFISHDLNTPFTHDKQYDLTTDFGTLEHVFDVSQSFRTMHELTKPGGFMMHILPCQGCYDHGFYNFHPTFFYDLAASNEYRIISALLIDSDVTPYTYTPIPRRENYIQVLNTQKHPKAASLFFLFQKFPENKTFKVPQQGYYSESNSQALEEAWRKHSR